MKCSGGTQALDRKPRNTSLSSRFRSKSGRAVVDKLRPRKAFRSITQDVEAEGAEEHIGQLYKVGHGRVTRPSKANDPAVLRSKRALVSAIEKKLDLIEYPVLREKTRVRIQPPAL